MTIPAAALVFVVDDDAAVRKSLQRLARTAGYEAETFTSMRGGCLVLDIYMGGMNGFELQERLVSDRCSVPIIFITAHDDPVTRERIRRSGAAGYLSKPFDPEALLDEIRRVSGAA